MLSFRQLLATIPAYSVFASITQSKQRQYLLKVIDRINGIVAQLRARVCVLIRSNVIEELFNFSGVCPPKSFNVIEGPFKGGFRVCHLAFLLAFLLGKRGFKLSPTLNSEAWLLYLRELHG